MISPSPHALSVLIATHNRRDLLKRCLDALRHQTQGPTAFEVIVADNGSSDGTSEMADGLNTPFDLRVLRLDTIGKAMALNAAIQAAKGRICLFVDDDVIAAPELVAEHVAAHEGREDVLGIGALTQRPPAARDWLAHAYAIIWNERDDGLAGRPAYWDDCYGGNFSASREALVKVGGFATDLRSAEDIELGFRLCRDAGSVPTYLPRARGVHDDQKCGKRILEDARRFGAVCIELLNRQPAMRSRLVGWFAEATAQEVTLRRVLLALRIPPAALTAIGSLLPGQRLRRVWCGFLTRYAFWRAVRTNTSRSEWTHTTRGTPVLLYHAFTPNAERDRYVLPRRSFAWQMRLLAVLRYRVMTLEDLAQALRERQPLPRRTVVITIDDGYRDNLEIASPILHRHGFPATIFLVSGRISGLNDWDEDCALSGRPLLSLDEISRMRANGIQFGAHTRSHHWLADATDEVVTEEITGSREDLEADLQAPVTTFAYPYGELGLVTQGDSGGRCLDRRAISAAEQAGFLGACTSRASLVHFGGDPLLIPRIEVRGPDSTMTFMRKLLFGGE